MSSAFVVFTQYALARALFVVVTAFFVVAALFFVVARRICLCGFFVTGFGSPPRCFDPIVARPPECNIILATILL